MARLTRREGIFGRVLYFWAVVTSVNCIIWGCVTLFFGYNWPIFLRYTGYILGADDLWVLGVVCLVTWAIGTLRYISWLIWQLHRWPPLASD